MFIYEFKSVNSLITKLVISGSHIVLYTNKSSCQEFNSVKRELNLDSSVSGDHPSHVFCHNPYIEFSARGDSIPHKHLKFPPNVNRLDYLKRIFGSLVNRQNDPSLRQKDYDTFLANLEKERQSCGDEQFPQDIQNAIYHYDLNTPYIPKDEIDEALTSFKQYLNNTHSMNVENIGTHAEELLNKHWEVIYEKDIIGFGEKLSESETRLCAYYDDLLELRKKLLGTISVTAHSLCLKIF